MQKAYLMTSTLCVLKLHNNLIWTLIFMLGNLLILLFYTCMIEKDPNNLQKQEIFYLT